MVRTFFVLFCWLAVSCPGPALSGEIVDRVVAVVNDEIITLSELNAEAEPTFAKIREQVPPEKISLTISQARKEILSAMIDNKLVTQRAAKRKIEVTEEEIDAAIDNILQENNATREQFLNQLAAMGTTEENYRKTLKSQILRSKLISYEIRSKLVVTNEQIEEYYKRMNSPENTPEGYHILQIGLSWGENGSSSSRQEARKKAGQLRDMVVAGENFKELASDYSDLPSGVDGGDIGVFRKDELAGYMWEAIKELRPGEVSKVIETPSGFQFFKLLAARVGDVVAQAPLDSVRDEIRASLYDEQMKERFDNWLKQLRDHSYVKELL